MTEASTQTQDTRVSSGGNRESTPVSTGIRAGSLVLFCILRTLTIAAATTPRILPDESGSWSFSRFIAGGASIITMHQQPEYRFGTGLLLSPLWAVTSDPLVRYRLGLVLLSAAPILAAWCIARSLRLLSLGDNVLRSTAFAMVLLFPATMMTGSFTWAEPLSMAWWGLIILGMTATFTSHRPATALFATSLVAGFAPFVHGRMYSVTITWVCLLLFLLLQGQFGSPRHETSDDKQEADQPSTRALVGSLAVTVMVYLVASVAQKHMVSVLWSAPSEQGQGIGLGLFTQVEFWSNLFLSMLGQIWYLAVSSCGLALLGIGVLAQFSYRSSSAVPRALTVSLAAMFAGAFALSNLLMTSYYMTAPREIVRYDHLFYGRYNDAVIAVLSVIGLLALSKLALQAAALALTSTTAAISTILAVVVRWRVTHIELSESFPPTIAGLAVLSGAGTGLHILRWSAISIVLCMLLGIACYFSRSALLGLVLAAVVLGSVSATRNAIQMHQSYQYSAAFEPFLTTSASPKRAVVSSDAADLSGYSYLLTGQQYQLVDNGWSFTVSEKSSAELAAEPEPGTELLVLAPGFMPTGNFQESTPFGPVVFFKGTPAPQ